jgi:hypothetical protein
MDSEPDGANVAQYNPGDLASLEKHIAGAIIFLRGHRVLLDRDLAALYQVDTKTLKRAVRRNTERFPSDFMFQLTKQEFANLRYQSGTSSSWGGERYPPFAFTEQGVAMLSSALRSQRAVLVNVEIMRTFVRLRQMLTVNSELTRRLDDLEKKYDVQFKVVFDTIRALMSPKGLPGKRPIGFTSWEDPKRAK